MPAPLSRWLLLIHQIPPHPSYLRVKVGRRLQALGALPVKNSVYVLPRTGEALEDFQWVRREILAGKGDATLCEARFVEGLSDEGVEALFVKAREADYAALLEEARSLRAAAPRKGGGKASPDQVQAGLVRLRKRLQDVAAIDFFRAPGREPVEEALASIELDLRPPAERKQEDDMPVPDVRGRTWVTRRGVKVDRIASAWLIRRFIDPRARFRFVPGPGHRPRKGELRFDMSEGEFTHEGEECTFEVLRRRFRLRDKALGEIAEIVHDVDLKDARFARPEAPGLERLVAGIALRHRQDPARLRDGAAVFEGLYEYFKRTPRTR